MHNKTAHSATEIIVIRTLTIPYKQSTIHNKGKDETRLTQTLISSVSPPTWVLTSSSFLNSSGIKLFPSTFSLSFIKFTSLTSRLPFLDFFLGTLTFNRLLKLTTPLVSGGLPVLRSRMVHLFKRISTVCITKWSILPHQICSFWNACILNYVFPNIILQRILKIFWKPKIRYQEGGWIEF